LGNFFIENKIKKVTYVIEMILAGLLAMGIVVGLIDLIRYLGFIFSATLTDTYDIFQGFLAHALILIVGIELILMIINPSTKAILELVLFVIARKMLIYSNTMVDVVLGTIALAIVFVILRFLAKNDREDMVSRGNSVLSAVDGLVCNLADEAYRPIEEGAEFKSGDYKIKITKATDDGLIEEAIITSNEENEDENEENEDGKTTFKYVKEHVLKLNKHKNDDNDE